VLGAGLAAVVGTSPLTGMNEHRLHTIPIFLASVGLVLIGITLLLVLRVMCPRSVSLEDVENAGQRRSLPHWARYLWSPLHKWRQTIESQQDLYLPCGVTSVRALRQTMIVEEYTLMALSRAEASASNDPARKIIHDAQTARAVRLLELRNAAAKVAMIGEYYNLRRRSSWATVGGVVFGITATACVITAFAWPLH
jgi:hypothetical protein